MQLRAMDRAIHIEGKSYWPSGWDTIWLKPWNNGITINWVPVNADRLHPTSMLWARYLVLLWENGKPVSEVVEHLLSAVHVSWIKDIDIFVPQTIPVVGPGIDELYQAIMSNSSELGIRRTERIWTDMTFISKNGECELVVRPWIRLTLKIERKNDSEIWLDSSIYIPDLYSYVRTNQQARRARPIARLKSPLVDSFCRTVNTLWWSWISKENYLLNRPKTSQQDLIQQMFAEFQEGANEHLAHTAVADFFWELHTFFPDGIIWTLEFRGKNNHLTRMELLRTLRLKIWKQ